LIHTETSPGGAATHVAPPVSLPVLTDGPEPVRRPLMPELDPPPRSFLKEQALLARMAWRAIRGLSPRVAWKVAHLYAFKGAKAVWSYKRRLGRGEVLLRKLDLRDQQEGRRNVGAFRKSGEQLIGHAAGCWQVVGGSQLLGM